jgi:hypothetical protein
LSIFEREEYKFLKVFFWSKSISSKEWYFVTKIVLTYCGKKSF